VERPERFRPYHEIADPAQRRKAIVDLYLEGWSARAIASYLVTSRARVSDTDLATTCWLSRTSDTGGEFRAGEP
jgi:hypothetical protein